MLHGRQVQSRQIKGGEKGSPGLNSKFRYPDLNLVETPNVGPTFPPTELRRLMNRDLVAWWSEMSVKIFDGEKHG